MDVFFQVDTFKAILETLELLKLDLANTLIAMIRPHVQAESVVYERTKFDEMLKVQDGIHYILLFFIIDNSHKSYRTQTRRQPVIRVPVCIYTYLFNIHSDLVYKKKELFFLLVSSGIRTHDVWKRYLTTQPLHI